MHFTRQDLTEESIWSYERHLTNSCVNQGGCHKDNWQMGSVLLAVEGSKKPNGKPTYPTAVPSGENKSWREIKQWYKIPSQVRLTASRVGLLTDNNGVGVLTCVRRAGRTCAMLSEAVGIAYKLPKHCRCHGWSPLTSSKWQFERFTISRHCVVQFQIKSKQSRTKKKECAHPHEQHI